MLSTTGVYNTNEIRDDLMQMDTAAGAEATSNLVLAVVLLCDKIGDLNHEINQQKSTIRSLRNSIQAGRELHD